MGSGLYHTLNIGSEALFANRQGVDTASHNIAGAQVEGFSRQRVNLEPRIPTLGTGGVLMGNGTYVKSITRSHDQFIEKQINRANQVNGALNGKLQALKNLEGIFSPELASSISEEMTNFFNSIQDLATSPEDLPVRTSLRETAKNLTESFKRVDSALRSSRLDLNDRILQETGEINEKLANIASLNIQINETETTPGATANDLRDKRDLFLRQLSDQMEITYFEDNHGCLAIKGPNQVTLVDRGFAASLQGRSNSMNEGLADIVIVNWEGQHNIDITNKNESGKLSGLLEVRDKVIPNLLSQNNQMAFSLTDSVNQVHSNGFGLGAYQDTRGRNFFTPVTDINRAAQNISLTDDIVQSADAISIASSPQAPGDNVLANDLIRIKSEKILNNNRADLSEYYANFVGQLGTEINRVDHLFQAQDLVVQDLHAQRESISGVSLDEEAISLLKWQTAFTASSKVITTVDEMLETVLSLKR